MKNSRPYRPAGAIALAALWLALAGCATTKNTWPRRAYHNTTSFFNAYYNGNLALREGARKIDAETKDNYNQTLPVFRYSVQGATARASGDMEKAFRKGSKAIQRHSITAKPKRKPKNARQREFADRPEFVRWTWESHLLIGKSHFYRRDFFAAVESFSYIIQTYSKLPIKHDAQLWLAATYVEMGNRRNAEQMLKTIEAQTDFPKRLKKQLALVSAHFHLRQNNLPMAVKYLDDAVAMIGKRRKTVRYDYILAQIHQQLGDDRRATEGYTKAMKSSRDYEMAFNARINLAQLSSKNESDNTRLKRELRKMIKDGKNEEYLGRLYYALGKIAANEGNVPEAKENYLTSARSAGADGAQQGLSYLEVGKICLDEPDYPNAQVYMDSAMRLAPRDIEGYDRYQKLSRNLNDLVRNLTTVEVQDSLVRMAKMPEDERNELIYKAIAYLEKLERDEKARENMERLAASQATQSTTLERNVAGSGFYFYNPTLAAAGAITFQTKWGDRKLEDNWRRSDKAVLETTPEADPNADPNRVTDKKTREYYLQDIPFTDSAMRVSDSLVHRSIFATALIYKDKIEDLEKAAETFDLLLARFPQTPNEMECWHHLYKIHTELANAAKAAGYKDLLVGKYPMSRYAQSLTNPDFFKNEAAREQESRFLYTSTYKQFTLKQYDKVIANCRYADSLYPGNPYQSKFALLQAVAVGSTTDSANFVAQLDDYIRAWPQSGEVGFAKEIRRYIAGPPPEPQGATPKEEQLAAAAEEEQRPEVRYTYDRRAPHLYACVIESAKAYTNRAKFNLSNLNIDYFPMFEFQVGSELLSAGLDLITVRPFKDAHTATNYFLSLVFLGDAYPDLAASEYRHFVITEENLRLLMESKDAAGYQRFFEQNYPLDAE